MGKVRTAAVAAATVIIATASQAWAGAQLSVGLGVPAGNQLPITEIGILGVAAAGVLGGIWAIRRNK